MRYKIVAWSEYQHYRDRCPPWIKLHHSLLTSKTWIMGSDASRTLAIASMLLAARDKENDGSFDGDPEFVKRFAYLNAKPDFKQLIEYGFIELVQDASNALAKCNTETEAYTTTETETEKSVGAFAPPISGELLSDWLEVRKAKRAGKLTATAFKGLEREAKLAGISPEEAVKVCCERSWQSFKAEWFNKNPTRTKADQYAETLAGLTGKGKKHEPIDITPTRILD